MRILLLVLLLVLCNYLTGFSQSRNVGIGEISVIEFAPNGNVWVGSNGNGLIRYNPTTQISTSFDTANAPIASDSVTSILCVSLGGVGYVFAGTNKGLARFTSNVWDTIPAVSGQHVTGVILTAGDSLWVVTANNGAFIFDSTGQNFLGSFNTGNSGIPTDQISTAQRGATNCGSYTIGTLQQGCFYTSDGINYSILDSTPEHRNLVDNHVTAVYMKKDCSAMFVGTKNGYSSCPPGVDCTNFTTANSALPQNYITAIGEDCNGKVWLGTKDSGVIIYNPRINATTKFSDVYDSIQSESYFLSKGNDGLMYGDGTTDGPSHEGLFFWFNPVTYAAGGISFDTVFAHGNLWNPVGNPVAIDTMIWGITLSGGQHHLGTIFRCDTHSPSAILTAPFDTGNGSPPVGITTANNILYGVTGSSPNYPYGTVFRYPISPPTITRVAVFDSVVTGAYPDGSLTVGDNGLVYGSTPVGGAHNKGTLFQFDPGSNTLTKLYDFQGAPDGDQPSGPVIRGSDGLLYGTTQKGGATNNGVLFAFDSASGTLTKVNEFDAAHSTPNYLYQAQNGIFYGLTQGNNGSLFQYNRYNGIFNSIYQFDDTDGIHLGSVPYPNMTENPQGNVFGRTAQGGLLGIGAIFQFNPQYSKITTYSTANGLASNQVTAIAFDPNNCNAGSFIGTSDGNIATVDSSGIVTQVLTGLQKINVDRPGVYLYPQPASGPLKFVLSEKITGAELIIADMAGRRLAQYNVGDETFLATDVSALSSDIYFYSLVAADGVVASGKVAVVH